MKTINGNIFKNAIIYGINELDKNKETINSLNVFPVPDGDTGTNMTMTAYSAANEVIKLNNENDIFLIAKAASSGALRGARGNSGVILSQLFRGFAKGLEDKNKIDTKVLANAFVKAMEAAYKAVMKPKEGTILTIAKALAEAASEICKKEDDIIKMLEEMLEHSHRVLIKTQFMLPELKEAKVVDAGGRGLIYILEGAINADYSKNATLNVITASKTSENVNVLANAVGDIKFAYCTEMFIDLATKNEFSYEDIEQDFLTYLDSMGDSIVLVGDENIVKIHIHTNNPGAVMERAVSYGDLSNIKIENMRLQHQEIVSFATDIHTKPTIIEKTDNIPQKNIGVLAVSSGNGFNEIFQQLNVDQIIEGGQTMNPSTENFLTAIEKINAKEIIILPNNSNIILAAQQAKKMSNKNVHVLTTKTVPEGIAAMYNYNIDANINDNIRSMEIAVEKTQTGLVTYAVKDSSYKNINIKNGDILCILNGEIVEVKSNIQEGAKFLINIITKNTLTEFINIYYGEETKENEAMELKSYIEKSHKDIEIDVRNGGQSHYYYIISAE